MILIIIYLIGCVIFYISIRITCKIRNEEWTKGNRLQGLLVSLFSWGSVFILCVMLLLSHMLANYNSDDKANW